MSHFSYVRLIEYKVARNRNIIFFFETSSVRKKIDLEGHYPQNTISHYIISNGTQITKHFFQGRISAMPEIRANLFLAISEAVM